MTDFTAFYPMTLENHKKFWLGSQRVCVTLKSLSIETNLEIRLDFAYGFQELKLPYHEGVWSSLVQGLPTHDILHYPLKCATVKL